MLERMSHRFIDVKTGETFMGRDLMMMLISEMDGSEDKFDWIRLFVSGLPGIQEVVNSKAFNVLAYILSHMDFRDNTFEGSYETISNETGISFATVVRAMEKFRAADIIRPRRIKSTWMLNPHYGFAGRKEKKAFLEDRYWELKSETHFTRYGESED